MTVWVIFVGKQALVLAKLLQNLVNTAALPLTDVLVDCSKDFQEVRVYGAGGILKWSFVVPNLKETSWRL